MNRIYRLIWNRSRKQWNVAAEITCGKGKSARTVNDSQQKGSDYVRSSYPSGAVLPMLCATVLLTCVASTAWADSSPPGQGGVAGQSGGYGGNGGAGGTGSVDGGLGPGYGLTSPGAPGSNGNGGEGGTDGAGGAGGSVGNIDSTANQVLSSPVAGGNGGNGSTDNTGLGSGGGGGGTGVLVSPANAQLTNTGQINGGSGGGGGQGVRLFGGGGGGGGGDGVAFTSGGLLINSGLIAGGSGGAGGAGNTFNGGASGGGGGGGGSGVVGANLTIFNSGTIAGGAGGLGGYSVEPDGNAMSGGRGAAVQFTGGTNTLVMNSGSQINGAVWIMSGAIAVVRSAADGLAINGDLDLDGNGTIDTQGYTLTVDGSISGNGTLTKTGSGTLVLSGSTAGSAISVGAGGLQLGSTANSMTLNNTVSMSSGSDLTLVHDSYINGVMGNSGLNYQGNATVVNTAAGSVGNSAVEGASFTLTNGGSIVGGGGGNGGRGFSNNATIYQGAGGAGASGVTGSSFTATNSGAIRGGVGGGGGDGGGNANVVFTGAGGVGGNAVSGTGFALLNNGTITGGDGGVSGGDSGNGNTVTIGVGGGGGAGVSGSGFALVNNNAIVGGSGGVAGIPYDSNFTLVGVRTDGNGGAGVVSTGGATVVNGGSITGGMGASGQADAVDFSGGGNVLILESGYSFTGNAVSSSGGTAGGDTLALGGSGNATFNVAQIVASNPGAYSGTPVFAGFENYTKTGSGTWTLVGSTTVSTHWSIAQGTLSVSSDSSLGGGNQVSLNGGSLQITGTAYTSTARNIVLDANGGGIDIDNAGNTFSVTQAISGSGGLEKLGSGTLILDGANTYTGGTVVNAGTLEIGDSSHASTASINGPVDVEANGTLRGHGSINGNVINDGVVWPGGSIGVLTINGNYTQNADGVLRVDVTPSQASQLQVNGAATLGGSLILAYAPGAYTSTPLQVINATSVSGTFADITASGVAPGAFQSQIVYVDGRADLLIKPLIVTPSDGALYGNMMRSVNVSNQQAMDTVLNVSPMLSEKSCGGQAASQSATVSCQTGVWAQYTGSSLLLNGADGLQSTGFGLLAGADHAWGDTFHFGLEAGVGQINGHDVQGGNARVENAHAGLYTFGNVGPLVLSATVDDMYSSYRVNRATAIGAVRASPDGNTLSAALQAAWPLQLTGYQLTPKAGVMYEYQQLDSFNEAISSSLPLASAFAISGVRSHYITLQPYAAMSFSHDFDVQGVKYVPQLSVGYRYQARNTATPTIDMIAQDGTAFAVPGAEQGRGLATVSAGITAQAGASWSLYLNYQGLFASHLHDNAISFGFTKHF